MFVESSPAKVDPGTQHRCKHVRYCEDTTASSDVSCAPFICNHSIMTCLRRCKLFKTHEKFWRRMKSSRFARGCISPFGLNESSNRQAKETVCAKPPSSTLLLNNPGERPRFWVSSISVPFAVGIDNPLMRVSQELLRWDVSREHRISRDC